MTRPASGVGVVFEWCRGFRRWPMFFRRCNLRQQRESEGSGSVVLVVPTVRIAWSRRRTSRVQFWHLLMSSGPRGHRPRRPSPATVGGAVCLPEICRGAAILKFGRWRGRCLACCTWLTMDDARGTVAWNMKRSSSVCLFGTAKRLFAKPDGLGGVPVDPAVWPRRTASCWDPLHETLVWKFHR